MSIREFKWIPSEKKVARASFDMAYNRKIEELKSMGDAPRKKNYTDYEKDTCLHRIIYSLFT